MDAPSVHISAMQTLEVRGQRYTELGEALTCAAGLAGPWPSLVAVGGTQDNHPGGSYGWATVFAGSRRGVHDVDDADMVAKGTETNDVLGHQVAIAGDLTGDGLPDLVATALGASRPERLEGGAFVFELAAGETTIEEATLQFSGSGHGARLAGLALGERAGPEKGVVLALGHTYSGEYTLPGHIDFHAGSTFMSPIDAEDHRGRIAATDPFHGTGAVIAIADLTGDGVDDLVTGQFNHESLGSPGQVVVVAGPLLDVPERSMDEAVTTIRGDGVGESLSTGSHLAVGDLDGDGVVDLVFSEHVADGPAGDRAGRAFVFFGPLIPGVGSVFDADLVIDGEIAFASLGAGLATLDHNGDGHLDLAIASPIDPYFGPQCTGRVYVFAGPISRGDTLAPGDAAVMYEGDQVGSTLGWSMDGCDLDGDGADELVIGGRWTSFGEEDMAGRVQVVPGGPWPNR